MKQQVELPAEPQNTVPSNCNPQASPVDTILLLCWALIAMLGKYAIATNATTGLIKAGHTLLQFWLRFQAKRGKSKLSNSGEKSSSLKK